jgi:hypothetical protein
MQLGNTLGVALASLGLIVAHNLGDTQTSSLSLQDFQMSLAFIAFISFMGLVCLFRLPSNAGESIRKT